MPPSEVREVSIIVIGSFNPAIFQPLWFSRHGLISEQEADAATIQIVHPQAAIFSTDWFFLQVVNERFMVVSADPAKTLPLKDLAVGTFRILEHTPIKAFGLNRGMYFSTLSEEARQALDDYYAPKATWNEIMSNPGLRSLRITGKRDKCDADQIETRIDFSSGDHPGVSIHINQHYQIDKGENGTSQPENMAKFLEMLNRSWEDFLSYSEQAASHILADCTKTRG